MDHACHQCGQEIEEGTPFCRHCGAPQIRVAPDEEPVSAPMPPGTPADAQPPAVPVAVGQPPQLSPGGIDWSNALPAALWAGAVLAAAWIIPYIGYFLWILAAGVMSVALYRRRAPNAPLAPGIGARIGAVSGLFGFAGFAGLMAIGLLLLRGSTKFRELLQQAMQQAAASNPDPRAQEMLAKMTTPAGLAVIVTIVMIIFLAGFVALSSAGGALGGWIFGTRKERPKNS